MVLKIITYQIWQAFKGKTILEVRKTHPNFYPSVSYYSSYRTKFDTKIVFFLPNCAVEAIDFDIRAPSVTSIFV